MEEDRESVLRFFEVALLEEIGYGLSLDREADGHTIDPATIYAYVPNQGPVAVTENGSEGVHGATLLGLKRRSLNSPCELREAKRLMRRMIDHHLDGKTLKSRDLFRTFGKSSNP